MSTAKNAARLDPDAQLQAALARIQPDVAPELLDPATPLVELGLDSLSLVAFLAAAQETFHLSVSQLRGALDHGATYGGLLELCRHALFDGCSLL